jgi:hypothetical protein
LSRLAAIHLEGHEGHKGANCYRMVPKGISDCALLTDSNATTEAKALTEKTFVTFVPLVVRNTV